ncbi:MAG: CBS domain-containing protein [Proteobacteria bacterium]|nr:CBS domain-containing protein [Pseudomonadota bacterium]MBU1581520.1 CBS domain-containing protein [Pseudomonadota bacterium]MBU2454619.1 CBS domain-containing protein [Pseudomonadota bacterium]MBU2628068.1 CBS domain-containing protein [Pseudomonadota bacterium]
MKTYVKDIMVTEFDTIASDAPVEKATQMILNGKIRKTGNKTVSLMVLDNVKLFVGIITMADILYHLRPDYLNYGIKGEEVVWAEQFDLALKSIKEKKVCQIMSTNIVGASADEHLMVILDRMVKNKYHRLPVLSNGRPIGVVYLSDIFYNFFS